MNTLEFKIKYTRLKAKFSIFFWKQELSTFFKKTNINNILVKTNFSWKQKCEHSWRSIIINCIVKAKIMIILIKISTFLCHLSTHASPFFPFSFDFFINLIFHYNVTFYCFALYFSYYLRFTYFKRTLFKIFRCFFLNVILCICLLSSKS